MSRVNLKPVATQIVRQALMVKPKNRPLDEFERNSELNAVFLSLNNHPRIQPIRGTIGFTFRNLAEADTSLERNEVLIFALDNALNEEEFKGYKYIIERVLKAWHMSDIYSRGRVDFFDVVAKRLLNMNSFTIMKILNKFLKSLAENEFDNDLFEAKSEVLGLVRKFAKREKNFADRQLMAKATGVISDGALVNIDNRTTNNNLVVEANEFAKRFRSDGEEDDEIPLLESANIECKQLEEAKDYVDAIEVEVLGRREV